MIEAFLGPLQRWLMQAGTLFVVGISAWRWIVWPRSVTALPRASRGVEVRSRADEILSTVAGMGCLAAILLVADWLLGFAVQILGFRDPFVPLGEDAAFLLQRTFWGSVWIGQGLLVVGLALTLWRLARPYGGGRDVVPKSRATATRRTAGWGTVAVLSLGLPVTMALSSHAMSVSGAGRVVAVGADAFHTVAAGGWIGALSVILLLAIRSKDEPDFLSAQLRAFSPMALVAVPLLVLMGGTLAVSHVPSIQDLWQTPYGQVLAAKILFVAMVLLLGFTNWRRGLPALDSAVGIRTVRYRAGLEVGLAGVVLGLTAALTGMPGP